MKINKILTTVIFAGSLVSSSIVGCQEGELYDVESPEWLSDSINAVAARNANNNRGEDVPGLLIDIAKNSDVFEFVGKAEMVTNDVLLIETGSGGKNGNFVRLKEEGWLKDKISFTDVATISFDAYPTVNGSDWNYIFAIGYTAGTTNAYSYFDGTIGFIQRTGDPYEAFYPGNSWANGNAMGGTNGEDGTNPYNYFSGLNEANCNKWYHFDYVYSTKEISIYVNGIKTIEHLLTSEQGANIKNILSTLNEGQLVIGAGCDPTLENFGGYIANFTLRNVEYYKTGDFFNGAITPKESEIKSLTIDGPKTVPFGTTYEKLLEQVKIKVAYEIDGETREQDLTTSDVIATLVPDMSTVGKKTLSVYYNTTYAGKFQENVKAELEFEVVALEIKSLKISTALSSLNYFESANPAVLCDLEVVGVQNDGKEITLDNETLTIGKVDVNGKFMVSYKTADGDELSVSGTFGGRKVTGTIFTGEIIGNGKFVTDDKFGLVYQNNTDNAAIRTNYLTLPTDDIKACESTGILTISFWIKNYNDTKISQWSPIFMIKNGDVNSVWSYYFFRHRGQLLVNYAGWVDSSYPRGDDDWSNDVDWLKNNKWHYVVATISKTNLILYVDGEVLSSKVPDGTDGNNTSGFIGGLKDINFFALGGAQTNDWGDPDIPCQYSDVKVSNKAPTAEEVKAEYEANK